MKVAVRVEIGGQEIAVGNLFHQFSRGRESASFEYAAEYLNHPGAYKISPELELYSGPQPGFGSLPAAFSDAAPDRWGRNLIAKAIRENNPLRRITELDYLLGVSDQSRIGALRFSGPDTESDPQLSPDSSEIPPIIELPRLLAASRLEADDEMSAVKQLLGAGSASLGGARPKAQVRLGDDLWIAKFPHAADQWDVMAFEKLALDLAGSAGISVPETQLVMIDGHPVLLSKRFDRAGGRRIGYQSFMTALLKRDGDPADYLEIAEQLSLISDRVSHDLHELFRRVALNIAIRNTDDHLRNHGIVRLRNGWALSPAFDLNPNPVSESAIRATSVAGAIGTEAEIAALVANCEYFDLSRSKAKEVLGEVSAALSRTDEFAGRLGLSRGQLDPFAELFVLSRNFLSRA